MKERDLNFSVNEDTTKVVLNEEQGKAIKKSLSHLYASLEFLQEQLKNKTLTEGTKETVLSVSENYLVDILKTFNYESKLTKDKKERHREIRELNIENRELRKQLGEKASPEDVRETIKNMEAKIRHFWQTFGFSYIKDFSVGPYGIKVELNTSMLGAMFRGSEEELEAHKDMLEANGFILVKVERSERDALGFCEENINALENLFSKFFSDFSIFDIQSYGRLKHKKTPHIRDIQLYIRNFDEVMALPLKEEDS